MGLRLWLGTVEALRVRATAMLVGGARSESVTVKAGGEEVKLKSADLLLRRELLSTFRGGVALP